ncbi:hydroxyisourate hydrolase [Vibrio sp.]|uniref:5-hydroxyisourate hydrolase n=1 Tax=Vibrio viridaestus TaxID=2487322 RepID=A0A3N9TG48_9VIBR|nr:hydroxyisourate hydrolase [Vibrio viridaestus]MDC0612338.1 hydroxyisourate hydrolase [Vibrio sp.]RQW63119.1 hydroxyisourate hydrolase [Vibrio viridaestus]
MGHLTTHILDTTQGIAARGVTIRLYRLADNQTKHLLKTTVSNDDGRCNEPLLSGDDFQRGRYELEFDMGRYFSQQQGLNEQIRFLDVIVIRFGIDDELSHYHVPIIATPYSYSTYRGS